MRYDFENFHSYIDDFIVGALLLYAAYAVTRHKRSGPVLLVVAWAVLCGGLYGSFFGQLASTETHDVGGLQDDRSTYQGPVVRNRSDRTGTCVSLCHRQARPRLTRPFQLIANSRLLASGLWS